MKSNVFTVIFLGGCIANLAVFTWIMGRAMFSGTGKIMLDFNYYGEGWVELALCAGLALLAIPAMIHLMRLLTNDEVSE